MASIQIIPKVPAYHPWSLLLVLVRLAPFRSPEHFILSFLGPQESSQPRIPPPLPFGVQVVPRMKPNSLPVLENVQTLINTHSPQELFLLLLLSVCSFVLKIGHLDHRLVQLVLSNS